MPVIRLLIRLLLALTLTGFTVSCLAQEPGETSELPDFKAEIRYHFRERIPDAAPGEKNVSAPSYETEELPPARFLTEKHRRIIEGKVGHLPFVFYLRLTRRAEREGLLLEVNVVDPGTGRSVKGFPAKTAELSEGVADFAIPLSEAQTREAATILGNELDFITYVQLLVRL